MNGHSTFVATVFGLLFLAVLARGKRPLLFKMTPRKEDASLGRPRVGIHAHRFMNMAYVDFIGTFLLAVVLARVSEGSLNAWLIALLILGEVQHAYFGIRTETFRWFFMGPDA